MEMFQLDFIQRALLAGLAISCITPIIGLLLILKRQSMMAESVVEFFESGIVVQLKSSKG